MRLLLPPTQLPQRLLQRLFRMTSPSLLVRATVPSRLRNPGNTTTHTTRKKTTSKRSRVRQPQLRSTGTGSFAGRNWRALPLRLPPAMLVRFLKKLSWKKRNGFRFDPSIPAGPRSEEHTSELQSHHDIVCRLLLEKKKKTKPEKSKYKNKKDKSNTDLH